MNEELGPAPLGTVTRTQIFDDRGEAAVIWADAPPFAILADFTQLLSAIPEAQRLAGGRVAHVTYFDGDGREAFSFEWILPPQNGRPNHRDQAA